MSVIVETVADGSFRPLQFFRWILIALFLYLVNTLIVYPFLISPIRHVPGPWYARVSKLPLKYATYNRRRTEYVTGLLDRFGPVVVIATDQVHTVDENAMKTIYDKSAIKTSFYASMGSWKGITSTLGFLDYPAAAPSRNNLIQCFQNKNLAVLVENIQSHVEDFLKLLEDKSRLDEAVDGVIVLRLLALDIVTDVLWGEEIRLLNGYQENETPAFLRRFHAFSTWNATKSFIPGADLYVKLFGNEKWKNLRNDCNDMDVTAKEALERWMASDSAARRQKDVLSMLQSLNKGGASGVATDDVPAYMVEMLAAGSSTTSHTAAFACWLLTRHPEAQRRLYEELVEALPDPENFDIKRTMDLGFLDGVIRETMRIYPMIPGPLERHLGKDIFISGKKIPMGVVASTAAFNQGQLEDVYPDPQAWKPERWLNAGERMKINWIPFGTGCRSCPGSNLAITELKYMLGMIFRNFEATMPPAMEEDRLELADVFAAGSKSGYCWLKFKKRER